MEPKRVETDHEFKSLIAEGFVIVDFYADWYTFLYSIVLSAVLFLKFIP
jgi:hypothetical protein